MEQDDVCAAQLTILIPPEELPELETELREHGIEPQAAAGHGFDGVAMGMVFVTLMPAFVKALVAIHAKREDTKRHVTYQYKGLKVTSVSEETLLKIIALQATRPD